MKKWQRIALMQKKKVVTRLCEELGSGKQVFWTSQNSKIVYQNSRLSTIPKFNMIKVNGYGNQGKKYEELR